MRLLHTTSLTFGEFFNAEIPRYCILSHRWGNDEVTYQNMISGNVKKASNGFLKLAGACNLARSLGWSWLWIDTACIDKSSSSELSEAINSMFSWYSKADFCIAYLVDVPVVQPGQRGAYDFAGAFRHSNWWTRGWTLQELIAPKRVYFYNTAFDFIGTRADLSHEISRITGIEPLYLEGRKSYTEACIATRMSWSASRTCTREEDAAYCLLGLMQVSLPLLYGEGGKMAFMRLQLQILALSDDETIFAWLAPRDVDPDTPFGMLAESPRHFARSQNLRCTLSDGQFRIPYSFSNKGLQFSQYTGIKAKDPGERTVRVGDSTIRVPEKAKAPEIPDHDETLLTLRCKRMKIDRYGDEHETRVAIELRRVGFAWYRVNCAHFLKAEGKLHEDGLIETFYIPQPNMVGQMPTRRAVKIGDSLDVRLQKERDEERAERSSDQFKMFVGLAGAAAVGTMFYRRYKDKEHTHR